MLLYEDDDLFVINKPAGLLSHKNSPEQKGASVVEKFSEKINYAKSGNAQNSTKSGSAQRDFAARDGLVHRLDRDTSGVMVLAKTEAMCHLLQEEFRLRKVSKEYTALVYGNLYEKKKLVNYLARDKKKRTQKRVVYRKTPDSREAITLIEPDKFLPDKTLLKVTPITGRTHQIRLQLAHLGYPILGDKLYFFKRNLHQKEENLFLCARKITLTHPRLKKKFTWEVALPEFFQTKLQEGANP